MRRLGVLLTMVATLLLLFDVHFAYNYFYKGVRHRHVIGLELSDTGEVVLKEIPNDYGVLDWGLLGLFVLLQVVLFYFAYRFWPWKLPWR